MAKEKISVLFLCAGNSCRGPMAEGLANGLPRRDCVLEASSAGLSPHDVNPRSVAAMRELGIDISAHRPTHVRDLSGRHFDYVISLCGEADDNCPVFRGSRMVTFALPDPCRPHRRHISGDGLDGFRHVRDAVRAMLVAWFGPEA